MQWLSEFIQTFNYSNKNYEHGYRDRAGLASSSENPEIQQELMNLLCENIENSKKLGFFSPLPRTPIRPQNLIKSQQNHIHYVRK